MHNNNSTFLLSSLSCPVKLQKFCGPFFSAHERLSHSHYLYPRSFSTHLIIYPLQFSIQLVHVDTIILVVATLSAYTHSLHFFSLFFFFSSVFYITSILYGLIYVHSVIHWNYCMYVLRGYQGANIFSWEPTTCVALGSWPELTCDIYFFSCLLSGTR